MDYGPATGACGSGIALAALAVAANTTVASIMACGMKFLAALLVILMLMLR